MKLIVKPKSTLQGSIKKLHLNNNRKDKIKLDLNENLMGCSLKVIEALKKVTCDEISMYPEYDFFINKLASYLELETNNLMLTNGADEALRAVHAGQTEYGLPRGAGDLLRVGYRARQADRPAGRCS